jgi:hypothetical protein
MFCSSSSQDYKPKPSNCRTCYQPLAQIQVLRAICYDGGYFSSRPEIPSVTLFIPYAEEPRLMQEPEMRQR